MAASATEASSTIRATHLVLRLPFVQNSLSNTHRYGSKAPV